MDWDRGPKNDWIGKNVVPGEEIRNAPMVKKGQGKALTVVLLDKHGKVVRGVDKAESVVELRVRRLEEDHTEQWWTPNRGNG
eukprot:3143615-Rhodomonas_salina.1